MLSNLSLGSKLTSLEHYVGYANKDIAMEYEINEEACYLDMPNGLHDVKYNQKFIRAKSEHPYPCNYAAEKVPVKNEAIKILMRK